MKAFEKLDLWRLGLLHLSYSTFFGVIAALLANEGWGVAGVVVGSAVVIFQAGYRIPRGGSRPRAMAWWLPPVCVLMILLL